MLLSILIPTYNRCTDLDKNLGILCEMILENHLQDKVNILVYNNASTDKTEEVVRRHIDAFPNIIQYKKQNTNIGLEANALDILHESTSIFVMYLGDDDYISKDYLLAVVSHLNNNENLYCITPDYIGITPSGDFLFDRDANAKSQIFIKGFNACINNAWKAHQLSGIVFKRKDVYEEYKKRGVSNIYPFIFFIAYSCLKGDALYLPDYPVKVTQVPQINKDWNYGKDGLLREIFDNFVHLGLSNIEAGKLEINFMKREPDRFIKYKTPLRILRAMIIVLTSDKTKINAKFFILSFVPYITLRYYLSIVKAKFL